MKSAGFQLDADVLGHGTLVVVLLLVSLVYFYTGRERRIMELSHFGAQYMYLFLVLAVLSYLAVSTNARLVDRQFDALDRGMGFDWVAWKNWAFAHPWSRSVLFVAYHSLPIQLFFCYIYNAHIRASWRNSEIWWITFVSGLVTIAGSALFPASNPYVYYGLEDANHFEHMQHFLGLRTGTLHIIGGGNDEGLIQLPSFHTILAIMLTYNVRHNRWLFLTAAVLNGTLILGCPTEGSHYFIDLVAGAVVAAATIWVVRVLDRQPAIQWVTLEAPVQVTQ
jgi:hypothetical protein